MKKLFESIETPKLTTVFLFILAFVLLAILFKIWNLEQLHLTWKMIAMGLYIFALIKVFDTKQVIRFMGYCMMLIGLKCIWTKAEIDMIWKVIGCIAFVAQFYPFIKWNPNVSTK